MNLITFKATINDENRTLFKFLVKQLNNIPISHIEKLFRLKDIKVNGLRTNKKDYKIKKNDVIGIYGINDYKVPDTNFKETSINFIKIFEDENILVVEKPINIAIHSEKNCLDHQILSYLNFKKIDSFKPSHVGRLDKPTSGLIVYAKNYLTLVELNKKINEFEKYYEVQSDFPWERKKIILYVKYEQNKKPVVSEENIGLKMETIFFQDKKRKYAQIKTGRKHQIRLSLHYLGYPIYGDKKFNGIKQKRLGLHCCKLVFHNLSGTLEYLNGMSFISSNKL